MSLLRRLLTHTSVMCRLSGRQWYRRYYGGRWELHAIDICHAYIWLPMRQDRKWPEYRQPCSVHMARIEDWPVKA